MRRASFPLWLVPLTVGCTLLVAAHLAWWLSIRGGYIEACNPYWDGCTSISRAARHGLGNYLFRLLMLPNALLLAIHWWLCRHWLRGPGDERDAAGARLLAIGLVSAHALAVYVAFLGTQGHVYAFMRSYGVILYFGCGYLAQLVFVYLAGKRGRLPLVTLRVMKALSVLMLVLGLFKLGCDLLVGDEETRGRIADAVEWQIGLLLATWYLLQAWAWRHERVELGFARD